MPAISENESACRSESEPEAIREPCGVFPVRSGGPVIGLGLVLLTIAVLPYILGIGTTALPASILFGGFGLFLLWLGFTK
jgi:hypothetical protein